MGHLDCRPLNISTHTRHELQRIQCTAQAFVSPWWWQEQDVLLLWLDTCLQAMLHVLGPAEPHLR